MLLNKGCSLGSAALLNKGLLIYGLLSIVI